MPDTQDNGEIFYKPHAGDSGSGLHSENLLKMNLRKKQHINTFTSRIHIHQKMMQANIF